MGGVWLTTAMFVLGVVLNYVVPEAAFEVVLNMGALAILAMWTMICLAHLGYLHAAKRGRLVRHGYRAPLGAAGDVIVLIFLLGVAVLMGLDHPVGSRTLLWSLVILAPAFAVGWAIIRRRSRPAAPA